MFGIMILMLSTAYGAWWHGDCFVDEMSGGMQMEIRIQPNNTAEMWLHQDGQRVGGGAALWSKHGREIHVNRNGRELKFRITAAKNALESKTGMKCVYRSSEELRSHEQDAIEKMSSGDPRLPQVSPDNSATFSGSPVVLGAASRVSIEQAIHEEMEEIHQCYRQGLDRNSTLRGKMDVRIKLGEGQVNQLTVQNSTLSDTKMDRCVIKVLSRLEIPQTDGPLIVNYPFLFEPG